MLCEGVVKVGSCGVTEKLLGGSLPTKQSQMSIFGCFVAINGNFAIKGSF